MSHRTLSNWALLRPLVASLLVASMAVLPPAASAGGGSLAAPRGGASYGAMELNLNFRFPPSQAQVDRIKDDLRMASRILCDATEGMVRIKRVKLTAGAVAEDEADAWILDDVEVNPRSFVPGMDVRDPAGNSITGFTQGPGFHASVRLALQPL